MPIPETDDELDLDFLGLEAAYLPGLWLPDTPGANVAADETEDFPEYPEPIKMLVTTDGDEFPADFSIRIEED